MSPTSAPLFLHLSATLQGQRTSPSFQLKHQSTEHTTNTCNFSPFPPLYYTYLLLRQQPPKLLKIYFLFTHGNCSLLIFSNSRVNCLSLTRRKKYCLKTGAQHWRTIHTSPLRKSWPGPLHHNTCKRIC